MNLDLIMKSELLVLLEVLLESLVSRVFDLMEFASEGVRVVC